MAVRGPGSPATSTEVLDEADLRAATGDDGDDGDDDGGDEADATLASGAPVGAPVGAPGDSDATRIGRPGARAAPHPARTRGDATEPTSRVDTDDLQSPELRVGELLGPYRLVEVIGEGGMGAVYRAEQTTTGRAVAIKVLQPEYARRRDALSRFFQEARTVARIRHHNIVEVLDFAEGTPGSGPGENVYLVMELLGGENLASWAQPGVTLARALAVLAQICDGLAAAHAVGIIHRDLKPDNIRIVPDGTGGELVKLLDFGVAKLLHREDDEVAHETAVGTVIGTPAYMSPEQAGGLPVDGRADLYSVGTIMYELFCGQPMFTGRSFGEFVRKHLAEAPTPPRQTPGGATMDPRFEALILKCVEKDPAKRFASALELRDVLLGLLAAVTSAAPLASAQLAWAPSPTPSASPSSTGSGSNPAPSMRLSVAATAAATPWWLWLLVCGIAIALGISVAAWLTIK